MEFRYLLHVVRSGWWLLLGGFLLGLTLAAVVTWSATPRYSSSIRLFLAMDAGATPVDPGATPSPAGAFDTYSDAYQTDLFAQERTETYVEMLTSKELAARVVDDLGLHLTPAEVAGEVTATAVHNTVIVEATVTDASARRARDIAASLGRQFVQVASGPQAPDGATASMVEVTVVENPYVARDPVLPDKSGNLELGASLGLLVGFVLAQLRLRRPTLDGQLLDEWAQPGLDGGVAGGPEPEHGDRPVPVGGHVPLPGLSTRKNYTYTADADRRRASYAGPPGDHRSGSPVTPARPESWWRE